MSSVRLCALVLLAAILCAGGCDTTATQPETQVVVESYLQVEKPIGTVRLTRSVDTDEAYVPAATAVRDAEVVIHRLGEEGEVVETFDFEEVRPGVYSPVDPSPVRPRTTYRLEATPPDGDPVTATTTAPASTAIVETTNREAVYQGPNQPTFTVNTPQSTPGKQNILVLTTTSLLDFEETPTAELREQLTPPYANNYDAEEDSLTSFRVTSSGLLNEENFERSVTGIEVQLPWLAVAFFGPNAVAVNVIDDNLFDLIRSQQVQQGGPSGGGLAPGEIPNVIEHVEGGTGIFGSYARAQERVTIQRSGDASE